MQITVITGAGVSAESGLATFRDKGGLWDQYDFMKLASIEGWQADPAQVLAFYNARRKQLVRAKPNPAHYAIAALERYHPVQVITQNVDDLHERAGSTDVLHLHGELLKARSVLNRDLVFDISNKDIQLGDLAPDGGQLRPDVVWFGEPVPNMLIAAERIQAADRVLVIGTSLSVYPAASLIEYVDESVPVVIVDPHLDHKALLYRPNVKHIKESAAIAVPLLVDAWSRS